LYPKKKYFENLAKKCYIKKYFLYDAYYAEMESF